MFQSAYCEILLRYHSRRPARRPVSFVLALATSFILGLTFPVQEAMAAANAGGVMILHADPDLEYTSGVDYCGGFDLDACENATTNLPRSDVPTVWWVSAAFPIGSSPRLAGVVFGIEYDPALITLSDFRTCGEYELAHADWPDPYSGTSVVWFQAQTSYLTPVYWFAGYSYYSDASTFSLRPHPTQGAVFGDDSVPAQIDPIADFGKLGFNSDLGYLPCPAPLPGGSCCLSECECVILPEPDCLAAGGTYIGDSECSVDACGCPPSACCFDDGSCELLLEADCLAAGGESDTGRDCDPNPCPNATTGRCCLGEDLCEELNETDCSAAGGIYGGDGTRCRVGSCPGDCDPIPRPNYETASRGDGPNVGGVLVLHHAAEVQMTDGQFDYCEESDLADCASSVTRSDGDESVLLYIFAAFPESTDPDVLFATFGIYYPTCITVEDWGHCGSYDYETQDFPDSGTGYGVSWDDPLTSRFLEIAWLAVSVEPGFSGDIALGATSGGYGEFGGGPGLPVQTNPVADYGVFGFATDGYAPCPPPVGACCFSDGQCQILDRDACADAGGTPVEGVMTCDPNPCEPTPVIETSWGKIKQSLGR